MFMVMLALNALVFKSHAGRRPMLAYVSSVNPKRCEDATAPLVTGAVNTPPQSKPSSSATPLDVEYFETLTFAGAGCECWR